MTTSRKTLKKHIGYTCGELAAATLFMRDFMEGVDFAAATKIVGQIADLQSTTIKQCSFSFDKAQRDFASHREYRAALHAYRKAAYKHICTEFDHKVMEIVKEMNALMPADKRKEMLG